MKSGWMIRGGRYLDDFKDNDCMAIGWNSLGDLTGPNRALKKI